MTTYLGKSCSFGLPRVPFVNCHQFMYLVISLLVLRAGCGIWLYQFLIIAYLFTFKIMLPLLIVILYCHKIRVASDSIQNKVLFCFTFTWASVLCGTGSGFDPQPCNIKVIKNGQNCSSLEGGARTGLKVSLRWKDNVTGWNIISGA